MSTVLFGEHAALLAEGVGWMRACQVLADRYGMDKPSVARAIRRAEFDDGRRRDRSKTTAS